MPPADGLTRSFALVRTNTTTHKTTDTVMVHHIPGAMRSNAAIAAYFEALFPGSVKKVRMRVGYMRGDTYVLR